MTQHDDAGDREAILARRAALLSTALAAFACSSPRDPTTEPSGTGVATSTATVVATTETSAKPKGQLPPPLRAWSDVLAKAPPRGIPPNASAAERRMLEYQEQALTGDYDVIKAVWEKIPACDAADPGCRPTWREEGERAKAMFDGLRMGPGGFGGCGGAQGETATLTQRAAAHRRYLETLMQEVEAHLTATAEAYSAQGNQEWQKILSNAKKPPPMPCLSPCAMPEVQQLLQSVSFAKGDATLKPTEAATKSMLEAVVGGYKGNRGKSKIVVRGHASPDEPKPAELAQARAKAVADWLIGAGIPKDRIEVKSYGADAPVERNDDEARASLNRRVDFEAVPEPKPEPKPK